MITDFEQNGMKLISYLAYQGDELAIDVLVTNNDTINMADILYGYALAGNKEKVNSLGASQYQGALVRAYARTGNKTALTALENYSQFAADLVLGFAQAGNDSEVKALLRSDIRLINKAVEGYAACDHATLLLTLINGLNLDAHALYYAARSNQVNLVGQLLAKHQQASEIDIKALLTKAIQGYVDGRHFKSAVALLQKGADLSQAINHLHDANGTPSRELYLAFLAHLPPDLFAKASQRMQMRAYAEPSLCFSDAELGLLEEVRAKMEENNYYAAYFSRVTGKTCSFSATEEPSFPLLAELIKEEYLRPMGMSRMS